MPSATSEVFCMKKLVAFLIALCLIAVILLLNAPRINYGQGLVDIGVPAYHTIFCNGDEQAPYNQHKHIT